MPKRVEVAITEVTRRAIIDDLILGPDFWAGRLEEPDFLARIYPLEDLSSTDSRFKSAYRDIWQHRVNNPQDWEDDWVFTDDRFGLMNGTDEVFLRFLAETVHPVVRPDSAAAEVLVERYNQFLRADGFELHITGEISGHHVYGARSILLEAPAVRRIPDSLRVDAAYISQQITRMESAVNTDADLAIGTAKELVESVCKTILEARGVPVGAREDLPRLVKTAARELGLMPESIEDGAKAATTIRRLLSNLATISDGLAQLRNTYGTGHGRRASSKGLQPRHARLAAGAASTLATFLWETHEERSRLKA